MMTQQLLLCIMLVGEKPTSRCIQAIVVILTDIQVVEVILTAQIYVPIQCRFEKQKTPQAAHCL